MHLQQEFERLYKVLADESSPAAQKQAGVKLVPLIGRAIFLEQQAWQQQGLTTLHVQQFVLRGVTYSALPASLLVDIKAIPALKTFDPGSCNIFLLQPPNPRADPIVPVYELKRANRREANQLDLRWLELETLRNVIRSLLTNNTPKAYNMEHVEMMEGAYKTDWQSVGDPPLDPKLLKNC